MSTVSGLVGKEASMPTPTLSELAAADGAPTSGVICILQHVLMTI